MATGAGPAFDGPDFDWLTPQLAVGGSQAPRDAWALARVHGIDAVIDLRAEACDDVELLSLHGVQFLHLPTHDLAPLSQEVLDEGVTFANRVLWGGRRLLIHCEHGIGRSATLALCVLISRGDPPLEALRLAKTRRWKLSPNPEQYECWVQWIQRWREGGGIDLAPPDFETFADVAYAHLRPAG
ncbi:MAG TPA: dual specificity protein phosphatase family protein [Caulobacteraceae bacterium]|nr:dual specificity protein phosphatase family protein [Caulobacteraceae bacterium]